MYREPRYTPKKLPKNRIGTLTSNLPNAPQIGKPTAAQDALLGIANTIHQGSKIKLLIRAQVATACPIQSRPDPIHRNSALRGSSIRLNPPPRCLPMIWTNLALLPKPVAMFAPVVVTPFSLLMISEGLTGPHQSALRFVAKDCTCLYLSGVWGP